MRIALLTDGLFPYKIGGMQKHSLFLARYMARLGVEVDLYFTTKVNPRRLQPNPHELLAPEEKKFVRFFPLSRPKVPYFPGHYVWQSYLISKLFFKSMAKKTSVDFIYAQGLTGWSALRSKKKTPILGIHPHGLEMYQPTRGCKAKWKQRMLRWAFGDNLQRARFVFSLGGGMNDLLQQIGVAKEKILLSPNGISEDWINPMPRVAKPPIRLLFVGRYEFRKGVEELHQCIKELIKKDLPFSFQFIGPIPVDKQIMHADIKYWGALRDKAQIQSIYADCDVLVCPSHSEGMPTVILEAMARGLAILATNVGTVRSMVDTQNGWLIPPKSTKALSAAIQEAISTSKEDLMTKKQNSQQKLRDNFLWEAVAAITLKEIQRALPE